MNILLFKRLQNLADENEKIEIVQDDSTEMFYVKINPQLENNPVQGLGDRAVLGLFHIIYVYCDSRGALLSVAAQIMCHTIIFHNLNCSLKDFE